MANGCDVSKILTTFLLNTCRLPLRLTGHNVQAAVTCGLIAARHRKDDEEDNIPLITGSVAEFYIEPMLPLVGDIVVMYHRNDELAIPRGHPPPTELPTEFHNYVKVLEIIDSYFPGYVYLKARCFLTQRSDDGKYEYFNYDARPCVSRVYEGVDTNTCYIHGPAHFYDKSHYLLRLFSVDKVLCLRCLVWPSQAADWPTRHRNYGWPDSATLDRVVSNGCDVVGVAHRLCRQHELLGKAQFRLSFSRAEIVLINSWMPVQQITYHILRIYVKTERLTESADNSEPTTISNYHIKTLMLWACELKPGSWWTENLNLVRICVELLNTLSVWLTDTRCPHYFTNNCNLLDNSLNVGSVASKLMSIDEEYLSTWLINNYIGQCAQLCPVYISRLFDDASTSMKLQKAVSEIVRWRLNSSLEDMWDAVDSLELHIPSFADRALCSLHSCICWMNELTKINKRCTIYFAAVAMLHVAHRIARNGFSEKLMNMLSTVLKFNEFCSLWSRCKTELNTWKLVELLQKSAVEHLTTYRQLMAPDFGSIATIVTTDFEALYAYKRGDYQQCLHLATQNVHTLLYADVMPNVPILPEFIQLMDDDIVSLTALTLIVSTKCRDESVTSCISQVTLSLYLMTQCQLKLHHSVTSLAQTLHCIKVAQRRMPRDAVLNQLTLKLTERKVGPTVV